MKPSEMPSSSPVGRDGRPRGDAGASTLEMLGIVTVAVLLVVAVLAVTLIQPRGIANALCRIESAVSGSGAGARPGPRSWTSVWVRV